MNKCCRHTTWFSTYPTLLESIPSKTYKDLDDLLDNKHRLMHHYLWTHSLPCPEQSGTHACLRDWNFIVHSFRDCFTDFSLGMIELAGGKGRVCILTAWKDLGTGQSPKGVEWLSHLYPNTSVTGHPSFELGMKFDPPESRLSPGVYRKFESIDESFMIA